MLDFFQERNDDYEDIDETGATRPSPRSLETLSFALTLIHLWVWVTFVSADFRQRRSLTEGDRTRTKITKTMLGLPQ